MGVITSVIMTNTVSLKSISTPFRQEPERLGQIYAADAPETLKYYIIDLLKVGDGDYCYSKGIGWCSVSIRRHSHDSTPILYLRGPINETMNKICKAID